MKKIYFLLIVFCIGQQVLAQDIHVVGYLPYYRFDLLEEIDFDQLTHINIAFANPKTDGSLYLPYGNVDDVVSKAIEHNVIPYISLGGGLTADWKTNYDHWMTKEKTPAFCAIIKNYCLAHQFEGVDMDLEWGNVTELYSDFVITLNDTLDVYGLGLTAALPGSTRYANISDEALQVFDVINMMVYDYTGPWDSSNPGQHSPYSKAVSSIDLWKSQGLEDSQLTLGLPFYGYDFTNLDNIKSFGYGSIVEEDRDNAFVNQVGEKYYNGINTIKAKTNLAINKNLLGVMIWELGHDAFAPNEDLSLLKAINEVFIVKNEDISLEQDGILVYPNPFQSQVNFESKLDYQSDVEIKILDMNGRVVSQGRYDLNNVVQIPMRNLVSGMYIYLMTSESYFSTGKLFKGKR